MSFKDITSRLREETLVLDGAMGTMIMRGNLSEEDFRGARFSSHPVALKGCNDVLVLTRPDFISNIHYEYLEAGASIISTDTFNANRFSLSDYALSPFVKEIAREGAGVARSAVEKFCLRHDIPAGRRPLVAGSMGPTGVSLSISGNSGESDAASPSFADMTDAYEEQASALIEGGVDLLLLETVFDTLNAKAAVAGIKRAFGIVGKEVPVIISATLTLQGRLLSGQTIEEFVDALSHSGALAFGLNCGFGAEALDPMVSRLAEVDPVFLSLHPNAGLPDEMGRYLDTPEKMLSEIIPILERGEVNIIGGCCGTTPDHIRLIAGEAKKCAPRPLPGKRKPSSGFMKIGERCNVAGSRKFLRLVREENWNEALDIAANQIVKGAGMLDINMDDAMLPAADCVSRFVSLLSADSRTSDVPLMIDSSDFDVISRTLPLLPLKGIVNSISLKNGEEEFIARARKIYDMGCDMVVMAFDEKGQADTTPRRVEIFSRAFALLTKAGIPATSIVFDPNVLAVATGIEAHSRYAVDFLDSISWIKENMPEVRISGGVSNLSFSFRGIEPVRKAMHSIFLELAIERGMDMAIINPATPLSSEGVEPELKELILDVLLCRRNDATDRLLSYAMELKKEIEARKADKKTIAASSPTVSGATDADACGALSSSLLSGDSSRLETLIPLAVKECGGSAMKVVEDALMKGMDRIGSDFAAGSIFLPQVVRSADVMKKAVKILTPLLEEEQKAANGASAGALRPRIVLATVKGDVHDIGKNIVAIVLRCSGFDVIDLGVMTPPEKIIETAVKENADAIGLSGLITPSLHEMGVVASMMEKSGLKIPLFVGGATTSDLHTAVRLAPLYSSPVVHTGDAASLPGVLSQFTSENKDEAAASLRSQQKKMRENYETAGKTLSLGEARSRAVPVGEPSPAPLSPGDHHLDIPVKEIASLINWRPFLNEWGLDPSRQDSPEAVKLLNDAHDLIERLDGSFQAMVVILPARRNGDDIIVNDSESIPTIRSLVPNPVMGHCLALSDFIAERNDHIALFAVTAAGNGIQEEIERIENSEDYRSLLLQSVSHRLVEAATEWTHRLVREKIWGIPGDSGIRPAVGYSSLPDQSLVMLLDRWLDYSAMGITITENGALYPSATTTGIIIAHRASRYFETGTLSDESIADYSARRGISLDRLGRFLRK